MGFVRIFCYSLKQQLEQSLSGLLFKNVSVNEKQIKLKKAPFLLIICKTWKVARRYFSS